MDNFEADTVVIGAGVVGLACAVSLAKQGRDVVILEATRLIGSGTSSRNSEVIHAGLYYPQNSLKHLACVAGRRTLYDYMARHGIAHRKCGKLIVATTDQEISQIEALSIRGAENGVEGLELIDPHYARKLEPELVCTAALLSKETGILDSHGLMLALEGELNDLGGMIAYNSPVVRSQILADRSLVVETGGETPTRLHCSLLVNSAGLAAQGIAAQMDGYPQEKVPEQYLAKGSYFRYSGRPIFERLIYPAPVNGGLGVHVTLDLQGQMRFGPDVEWLDHNRPELVDYSVAAERALSFYQAIRSYWPSLKDDTIFPDYSGCRPKVSAKGQPNGDFLVHGPSVHGVKGLVHLFGIESPGLTSSLALSELVCAKLLETNQPDWAMPTTAAAFM